MCKIGVLGTRFIVSSGLFWWPGNDFHAYSNELGKTNEFVSNGAHSIFMFGEIDGWFVHVVWSLTAQQNASAELCIGLVCLGLWVCVCLLERDTKPMSYASVL